MSLANETSYDWFGSSDLSKGKETQLRIIKAAIQLFGDRGFASVTLQDIAKKSKSSHPLILKHFHSKENLLNATRQWVTYSNHTWVDEKITPELNGYDSMLTFCLENLKWGYDKPEEGKIILLTYYYNSLDEASKDPGVKAIRLGTQRLHQYVLQAEREGLIHADIDSKTLVEMTHSFNVGLFVNMLVNYDKNQKRLSPQYRWKLQRFLNSFLKAK